jgi:hypothetical protein
MKDWYIYEDDEVVGPFNGPELAGKIEPDTLVCPAGEEEWKKASEREDVKPFLGTPGEDEEEETHDDEEIVVGNLEPNLETLTRIAREANAEDLQREFQEHWEEYDREEQKIIYQEMEHLGILPDN